MGKGVNYGGAFNRLDQPLAQLPEKPVRLGASFFRKILRRIETIIPTQSDEKEPLIVIEKPKNPMAPGLVISANTIEVDACVDGAPGKIELVGRVKTLT